MENRTSLTGQESLAIISRMINTAKYELEDDSFSYLLWGWLVFSSSLIHYLQLRLNLPLQGISWAILMPLGGIISMVYRRKKEKSSRVKTYIDDLMKYVLIAFLVSLCVTLFFMSKLGLST